MIDFYSHSCFPSALGAALIVSGLLTPAVESPAISRAGEGPPSQSFLARQAARATPLGRGELERRLASSLRISPKFYMPNVPTFLFEKAGRVTVVWQGMIRQEARYRLERNQICIVGVPAIQDCFSLMNASGNLYLMVIQRSPHVQIIMVDAN